MKTKYQLTLIAFLFLVILFAACKKSESDNNSCSAIKNEYNASWGAWNLNPTPANCNRSKLAINNYLNSSCLTDATERQQVQLNRDLVVSFCP